MNAAAGSGLGAFDLEAGGQQLALDALGGYAVRVVLVPVGRRGASPPAV